MARDILSTLAPAPGSRSKKKRIGRGQGSGTGGTSTRGHKGAHSRSGAKHRAWFEGGQMPLVRRVPKRGFHSPFKVEYQVINVDMLGKLAEEGKLQNGVVTPEILARLGVIGKASAPVKVLGNGELKAQLDVAAHAFSSSATEKIKAAGGKTQTISGRARD
jgi:large subunit ribosomal protein L15